MESMQCDTVDGMAEDCSGYEQPAASTFGRLGVIWTVLGAKVAKGSEGEEEYGKASVRSSLEIPAQR